MLMVKIPVFSLLLLLMFVWKILFLKIWIPMSWVRLVFQALISLSLIVILLTIKVWLVVFTLEMMLIMQWFAIVILYLIRRFMVMVRVEPMVEVLIHMHHMELIRIVISKPIMQVHEVGEYFSSTDQIIKFKIVILKIILLLVEVLFMLQFPLH